MIGSSRAGPLFGENRVEAFAVGPQRAEWISDRGRPVHAGDDAALFSPSGHHPNAVSIMSGMPFSVSPNKRLIFERL